MPTLLWFRRDLRLGDHPALAAAADNGEVLACFVLDPRLEASSGRRRLQFLGDSLRQLRDDLDGRLLVTRGRPEERIPAHRQGNSTRRRCTSRRFRAVRPAPRRTSRCSTGFRCRWWPRARRTWSPRGGSPRMTAPPTRCSPRFFASGAIPAGGAGPDRAPDPRAGSTRPQLRIEQTEIPDPGAALDVAAGEEAATKQWKAFRDNGLQRYAEDRNRPDLHGTSRMSAHLKFGTSIPARMVADLDLRGGGARPIYGSWRSATSTPTCCITGRPAPGAIGTAISMASVPTRAPSETPLRVLESRRNRLPDGGRRDAPTARDRLHAQPGAHDRRLVSGQRPASALAVGRRMVLGSAGRRRHGEQPARVAVVRGLRYRCRAVLPGVQPDHPGREVRPVRGLHPALGPRAAPTSTTCTCARANGRPTTRPRSSTTAPSAPKRCGATRASDPRAGRTSQQRIVACVNVCSIAYPRLFRHAIISQFTVVAPLGRHQ